MTIKDLKKADIELLSNKDITHLLLEEKGEQTTPVLLKRILKLRGLPEEFFDKKVGDYYTALATDKRFILLENGKWDLRSRHTSDKIVKIIDEEEDDEEEIEEVTEVVEDVDGDNFDSITSDEDDIDDSDDGLKDLVVIDEDDLELDD